MDALISLMISKFGWGALVFGLVAYLVIEGGLDILTDEISYRIQQRREKKNDS